MVEELELLISNGIKMVQRLCKTVQQLLIKSNIPTNNHTPRYLVKQNEIHVSKRTHTGTQSSLVCRSPKPETTPVHRQVNGPENGGTAIQREGARQDKMSSCYTQRGCSSQKGQLQKPDKEEHLLGFHFDKAQGKIKMSLW